MRDLLDVNVWVALAFPNHPMHMSARRFWEEGASDLIFCRLTYLGFLRISTMLPTEYGPFTVEESWAVLDNFLSQSGVSFCEEPPGIEVCFRTSTMQSSFSPKHWTDAYLASFAQAAEARLVSFDRQVSNYQCKTLIL